MKLIQAGASNQSVIVRFLDSVSGTPVTLVTGDTSGMGLWYRRDGGLKVDLTPMTSMSAADAAHTASGIFYLGDGYVRLDPVDNPFATGAAGVLFGGSATGMVVIGAYHSLVGYNPLDLTQAKIDQLLAINGLATSALLTMANIKAQVDEGLSGIGLDKLLSASGTGGDVATGALLAQVAATDGNWANFVKGTESLQAMRDRGDAAWPTADVNGLATSTVLTMATIKQQVDEALSGLALDKLLSASAQDSDIATGAFLTQIVGSVGDWSQYNKTTDSLEALRARGDSAWKTADVNGLATSTVVTMAAIKTQVDEGLSELGLDKLLSASGQDSDVADGSLFAQISTSSGDWSDFVKGNAALEALSDRVPISLDGGSMLANVGSISGDAVAANNAELFFDGTGYAGGATPLDVNVASVDDIDAPATWKASINTEVVDVLKTDTISEQAQGAPTTTPTFEEAIIHLYSALVHKVTVTATEKIFYNNAGTALWKKALSDDATTYTEAESASGP